MTRPQAKPYLGGNAKLLQGATWHKSSHSGTDGNCVEVARNVPGIVAVHHGGHYVGY